MEAATPGPPPPPPSNRVDIGKILGESFSIYGAQAGALLGTAAVIFLLVGVIQGLAGASDSLVLSLVGSIASIVGTTLYGGFVVKLVEDVRDGRRDDTVGDLLRSASGFILPLLGNGILKGIAVAIGLVLLVVPGLILLTIWAVTGPAIVAERRGAIEAFGRSRELVKGEGFPVFGLIVIIFLIGIGISIVAGILGGGLGDGGAIAASIVGTIIVAPITSVATAVLFFDLGGGGPQAPPPVGEPVDVAPPTPGT